MDCDNCEIAIAKKHDFANNTIQLFDCGSQSQSKNNLIFKVAIAKVAKIIILKIFF